MKKHPRFLLVLLGCLLLAACGAFGSLAELQSQSSAMTDALEKDLGVKPLVGWHYRNGSFTDVDVNFDAGKIEGMQIGELEMRVRAAVASNFKDEPQKIVVAVSFKP